MEKQQQKTNKQVPLKFRPDSMKPFFSNTVDKHILECPQQAPPKDCAHI